MFSQAGFAQKDCASSIAICGNSTITYTPGGYGNTQETLGGCLSVEHNSVWYKFTVATSGTLTFVITPTGPVDYDWALYGPNKTCATRGTPLRGSYATGAVSNYLTGLSMTATALCDQVIGGTGYAKYVDVVAGETYILVVDNYSTTVYTFSLVWGGTATLASAFSDPTLQPHPWVPPGVPGANPSDPRQILICNNGATFDFSTLTSGILNGNPNFVITYHTSQSDATAGTNPITAPIAVNTTTTYYYSIHYQDPVNPSNPINGCRITGAFKFVLGAITANNANVTACEINQSGTGVFDLTSANIFSSATIPFNIKYYPTAADATAGTNEITNPSAYTSGTGTVYAKVTRTDLGCTSTGSITLAFKTPISMVSNNVTIEECDENMDGIITVNLPDYNSLITTDPAAIVTYYNTQADAYAQTGAVTTVTAAPNTYYVRVDKPGTDCTNFGKITTTIKAPLPLLTNMIAEEVCDDDLDGFKSVNLDDYSGPFTGSDPTIQMTYYSSQADAYAHNNPLSSAQNISGINTYYVRFDKAGECPNYGTLKVTIKVPKESVILKDKIICFEQRTTLDAGPGFDSYLWSTGETTSSISNVGVGNYWVTLGTGLCSYTQHVKVTASINPVITNIEISNNTASVTAAGGNPPYMYSIDNINWQDSNTFENLPRGENTFYVKDTFNCEPVSVAATIVNLINVITPNGDGINDEIDYSALSYKNNLEFVVYDRYGTKLYSANKSNGYKWDGRFAGRKLVTGTYWFVFTWNENDTKQTPVKYSGWILIKNRE